MALIVEPPPAGRFYPPATGMYTWETCVDPYSIDPDAPRDQVLPYDGTQVPGTTIVKRVPEPWLTADSWEVSRGRFWVEANLSSVVEAAGPGVYTLEIWAESDGGSIPLTQYSIFLD